MMADLVLTLENNAQLSVHPIPSADRVSLSILQFFFVAEYRALSTHNILIHDSPRVLTL